MWQVKKFKTRKAMLAWLEKNRDRIQYTEISIENGYAVEWRPLRRIG